MEEISRTKKLEVAQYYLLGLTYGHIKEKTGISHGSIANIVKEVENGKLTIPGTAFDRVNDLRQLSLDLKKKGFELSQALLGLLLFERLEILEITPGLLDKWSELAKKLIPNDFPAKDFIEIALRLHRLEKEQGKPFATLVEEYLKLKHGVDEFRLEADSLSKNKTKLIEETKQLRSQLKSMKKTKNNLENDIETKTLRLQELWSKVREAEKEKSRLDEETRDFQRRKSAFSSEIGSKEESLRRLNDIGLSDEDLLRLAAFFERTSKNEGISGNQLKGKFFSALSLFEDVSALEERREAEMYQVSELVKRHSILSGEIIELDKQKGLLEGEIAGILSSTSSTSQKLIAIEKDAVSQMQQQVTDVKNQLNVLMEDALKTGEAIGEIRQSMKIAEESERTLGNFIKEVQSRIRRN